MLYREGTQKPSTTLHSKFTHLSGCTMRFADQVSEPNLPHNE